MKRITGISMAFLFLLSFAACTGKAPKATPGNLESSAAERPPEQVKTTAIPQPEMAETVLAEPSVWNSEYYVVEKNGLKGVVDGQGREVLPFRYAKVEALYDTGFSAASAGDIRIAGFYAVVAGIVSERKPYDTQGYVYSPDGVQLGDRKFSGAYSFGNGLIRVYDRDGDGRPKSGLITYCGKAVVPMAYDELFPFNGGIVAVLGESERIVKRVDVYDWQGKLLRSAECNFVYANGDYFVVSDDTGNGKGLVDSIFAPVVPPEWDQVDPVGGGLFIVRKGERSGLIDSTGKVLLPVEYTELQVASGEGSPEGLLFTASLPGGVFLFDKGGNTLFHSDQFRRLWLGGGFLNAMDSSNRTHVLDRNGVERLPPASSVYWNSADKLFVCSSEDGRFSFYTQEGKRLPLPESGYIQCVASGRFVYRKGDGNGGLWGLCDGSGRVIVPPQYASIYPMYQRNLLVFSREAGKGRLKYGLMDCDGRVLLDAQYDALYGSVNQRLLYAVAGPYSGLIDEMGCWVWHASVYDSLSD